MKQLITLFLAIGLSPLTFAVAIPTGKAAAEFSLKGHDGKTHKLSDYKGKTVVLEWYNKDCPFVVKHYGANNMQALQKKYTQKDVVWLSVISSAPGKQGHLSAEETKAQLKSVNAAPSVVLFDPDGKVGKSYDAKTTPHMYIISKDGTLVYQGAIDDTPSAKPATVKTAKPLFANALDMTLKGESIPKEIATNDPYGCSVKY